MKVKFLYLLLLSLSLIAVIIFYGNNPQSKKISCKDCNIIIIGYDTLGANRVSNLGYKIQTTPMLDKLASEGINFTNNISPSSWTVPAFMSIFTNLFPTEHKVVNKYTVFTKDEKIISNLSKLSPNVETIAQVLKNNNYATGGFTGDSGVSSAFGDNKGFDIYTDEVPFGSIENSSNHALSWLQKNKDKKFFMFLHGYDSHGQFKVPNQYQGMFMTKNYSGSYKGTIEEQAQLREKGLTGELNFTPADVEFWNGWYDSKIRDADTRFAKFWTEFEKMNLRKNTIIIILSDHGEEVYEHKGFDHGHSLYEELVHVPLVFLVPGAKKETIKTQTSTLDVVPTILDILGINPGKQYESQIRGKSLTGLITGQKESPRDIFLETDYRDYTYKRGIRTSDGWKYILTLETGNQELYNLKNDPHELDNVADKYPQITANLEKRVKNHMLEMGQNPSKTWTVGCLPVYADQCK